MNPSDIRHAYVHKDTYEELKTLGGRGIISAIRRDVSDVHVVVLHATDYEGMRKYIIEVDELWEELDRLRDREINLENRIYELEGQVASQD